MGGKEWGRSFVSGFQLYALVGPQLHGHEQREVVPEMTRDEEVFFDKELSLSSHPPVCPFSFYVVGRYVCVHILFSSSSQLLF